MISVGRAEARLPKKRKDESFMMWGGERDREQQNSRKGRGCFILFNIDQLFDVLLVIYCHTVALGVGIF